MDSHPLPELYSEPPSPASSNFRSESSVSSPTSLASSVDCLNDFVIDIDGVSNEIPSLPAMDPLSFAASLIAVVGLTTTAAQTMHRLIVSMRQAPDVILALSNELSDLALVLLEVKSVEDSSSLPPESRERLAVLLSRAYQKVDEVEKLAARLSEASSSSFLSVGRLTWRDGKAKAGPLQKDLRIMRSNIAAILAANSTSGILRLEVELNNLRIVTQQAQLQQLELHSYRVNEVTRHSGLLETFMNRMGPLLERHEEMSERLERAGRRLSINPPYKEKATTSQEPPPPYSSFDPHGLQVVGYRYQSCVAGCPCRCHKRYHHSTPPVLSKVLGSLFVGYSSLVVNHPRCDESSCQRPSRFSLQLIYCFPGWFLNRAIIMAMTQGSFSTIQASIALHKIVPQTADIFEFCAAGDVAGVHSLIKLGKASPHDTYRAGGSPLLNYAIERGQVQVVKFLLNVGADPLLEDGLGRSAIDFACINVFSNTFGTVVTKTFRHLFLPPTVLAQKKLSELHQIVVGLSEKNLKEELPRLMNMLDDQAFDGKTALSWAARRGDLEAVNLLLSHGADPTIYDLRGNAPLHSAACSTDWRCIPALLKHGADALHNNSRNESPVNYALFYADDPHYLQPLLDAGADVNGRDYHGDTPLITATYRAPTSPPVPAFGAVNCVDYLIQRGANTELASAEGNTPLLNAIIHNNCGAVLTLFQSGADHRVRNATGDTILHLTARHGDLALVQILSSTAAKLQNMDTEAINNEGYTPKEVVRSRVKYVEGFSEAFDELLMKVANEAGWESMVASTIMTVSSYEDAVEYQNEEKGFMKNNEEFDEKDGDGEVVLTVQPHIS